MKPIWERLRRGRLVQVIVMYLGASWVILQLADVLEDALALPPWVSPVTVLLLLIGLVIILATAWVQSNPLTDQLEERGDVPGSWEVSLGDVKESIARGKLPHLTWGRALMGGFAALVTLLAAVGVWALMSGARPDLGPAEAVAGEAPAGIAVVPFTVSGEDADVWREGMMDLFATSLDGVGGFRAIDSRTVLSRWERVVGAEGAADLATALAAARATGARYALVGNAVSVAGSVRISGDVYDLGSGSVVSRGRAEGSPGEVLALVDRLSVDIMRDLLEENRGRGVIAPTRVASITTSSLPALQEYLEGESLLRRSDFRGAAVRFSAAADEDSTFALALLRQSHAEAWASGQDYLNFQGVEARAQAARHADRLPKREAELLAVTQAFQGGAADALERARAAVRRYPDDPDAWALLGEVYVHNRRAVFAEPSEGIDAFQRAVALDPSFAPYYIHLIEMAIAVDDTIEAFGLLAEYERIAGDRVRRYLPIAVPAFVGDSAQRQAALASALAGDPHVVEELFSNLDWQMTALDAQHALTDAFDATEWRGGGFRAMSFVAQGRVEEALRMLREDPLAIGDRAHTAYLIDRTVRTLDEAELEQWVSLPGCRSHTRNDPGQCLLPVAMRAVDRGDWALHSEILDTIRAGIEQHRTSGDTISVGVGETIEAVISGYASLRRGQLDEARRALEAVQGRKRGPDHWVRWLLAETHAEAGRPREAIRYFRTTWLNSFKAYGAYRLGALYAEIGDRDKAREQYEAFLRMWRDADPDLPQLDEARRALEEWRPTG
ncbi:MAG: tetratricopeptide repeat protein [Gemmatimonadota bacterium]